MTFGSLFAGIGGFDLGLERAGMTCRWQVEIDPFCRKVLEKHWPNVPKYGDIRELAGRELESVDVIAGGFPCQDISLAGSGAGLGGHRSGLWRDMFRIVCAIRPRFVIVENVAALIIRGLDTILGDRAGIGFNAEWSIVSACSMGAPHVRRRLFIVAYPNGQFRPEGLWDSLAQQDWAIPQSGSFSRARAGYQARLADPSELYRGADAVPYRLERNRGLGNAVNPDCAEWIGRRVLEAIK